MAGGRTDVKDTAVRAALRVATRDLHDRLDAQTGPLADLAGYRRYLAATCAFRAALEPALDRAEALGLTAGWISPRIVPQIRQDLTDLGMNPPNTPETVVFRGMDDVWGALYVAEGSALGARLLLQRAQGLGLTPSHGAGHLVAQTAEPGRWRHFLDRLHGVGPDIDLAIAAARRVFALALSAYDCPGVPACPDRPPT